MGVAYLQDKTTKTSTIYANHPFHALGSVRSDLRFSQALVFDQSSEAEAARESGE